MAILANVLMVMSPLLVTAMLVIVTMLCLSRRDWVRWRVQTTLKMDDLHVEAVLTRQLLDGQISGDAYRVLIEALSANTKP